MTALSLQETARKKQLGQYFTGQRVGRLLAALAGGKSAKSIIDPMVGSADLLLSCLAIGATPDRIVGLELDPLAYARAESALDGVQGVELVLGDAFAAELPVEQFDLVITNPPYIRYQSKGEVDGIRVPSGETVRADLIRAIRGRHGLSDDARALWLRAAQSYPGTSDVAVPAWILSASLVRDGGMLAVVAPQAWLSRNYAHAVRELLDAAFDIEVIVEDGDASWFDDAQVRTHLVVARRRPLGTPSVGHSVVLARATSQLEVNGALHGTLRSEQNVADALREVGSSRSVVVTPGLSAHLEHDLSVVASGQVGHVQARVVATLSVGLEDLATRTLDSYGWRAGQGLRSGANDFFYVSVVDGVTRPANRWGIRSLAIPSECLLPAVRRQSELGDVLAIEEESLRSRVVNLRGWVTAPDKKRVGGSVEVQVLPKAVERWIDQVATSPLSHKEPFKLFPHLAAVTPNSKFDHAGRPVSFWYQLPDMTPRHCPRLFVGRVCGGQPTTYSNPVRAVIDANFATLWPNTSDAVPADALLAILNSSWVWANLEANCTVLGGGALKVEATDLRRVPLPDLTGEAVGQLTRLGQAVVQNRTDELVRAIDDVVANAVVSRRGGAPGAAGLRSFAEQALRHRSRR